MPEKLIFVTDLINSVKKLCKLQTLKLMSMYHIVKPLKTKTKSLLKSKENTV